MWQNKTRPKKTARLPYAYIPSEDDPLVLIPDQAKTNLVEQAMDHLDQGHSSRKVATWLTEKTGQKISHQGITNIWKEGYHLLGRIETGLKQFSLIVEISHTV